jgi:hypothetical protein
MPVRELHRTTLGCRDVMSTDGEAPIEAGIGSTNCLIETPF